MLISGQGEFLKSRTLKLEKKISESVAYEYIFVRMCGKNCHRLIAENITFVSWDLCMINICKV